MTNRVVESIWSGLIALTRTILSCISAPCRTGLSQGRCWNNSSRRLLQSDALNFQSSRPVPSSPLLYLCVYVWAGIGQFRYVTIKSYHHHRFGISPQLDKKPRCLFSHESEQRQQESAQGCSLSFQGHRQTGIPPAQFAALVP